MRKTECIRFVERENQVITEYVLSGKDVACVVVGELVTIVIAVIGWIV